MLYSEIVLKNTKNSNYIEKLKNGIVKQVSEYLLQNTVIFDTCIFLFMQKKKIGKVRGRKKGVNLIEFIILLIL